VSQELLKLLLSALTYPAGRFDTDLLQQWRI